MLAPETRKERLARLREVAREQLGCLRSLHADQISPQCRDAMDSIQAVLDADDDHIVEAMLHSMDRIELVLDKRVPPSETEGK